MMAQDIQANATQDPFGKSTAQPMQQGSVPAGGESVQQVAGGSAGGGGPPSSQAAALLFSHWAEDVPSRSAGGGSAQVQKAAQQGIQGPGGSLPHLGTIQKSFGRHDVSGVEAHIDEQAGRGARAMGAEAFATGNHVAFASPPDLHTAAHEVAHVVQQRAGVHLKGGIGEANDAYEQHADAVADAVVAGRSAEALLDPYADGASPGGAAVPVQRKLRYDGATTSLESRDDKTDQLRLALPVVVGDLLKVPGQGYPDAIFRVAEATPDMLTLEPYQDAGANPIELTMPNRNTRNSWNVKEKLNAARKDFDGTLGEDRQAADANKLYVAQTANYMARRQAKPDDAEREAMRQQVNQRRATDWKKHYDHSLTVKSGKEDQLHAINNLTIFHLTINSDRKAETHLTLNTDTLKLFLNSRSFTDKEFMAHLEFLQAVNLQAFYENGCEEDKLLSINGNNHHEAFKLAFGENGAKLLDKNDCKHYWAKNDYGVAKGNIEQGFKDGLSEKLLPGGYGHGNNVHFRITPDYYKTVAEAEAESQEKKDDGGQGIEKPKYQVDEKHSLAAVADELKAALNLAGAGLGDAIVEKSLAQVVAQLGEDNVPSRDLGDYFMVLGDLPQYREVAEMIKSLGGTSRMLGEP